MTNNVNNPIFFQITQDFLWVRFSQAPALFGIIQQENLPKPLNDENYGPKHSTNVIGIESRKR